MQARQKSGLSETGFFIITVFMSDTVIDPRPEKGEARLPDTGILCINPSEISVMVRLAREQRGRRRKLFNSSLFHIPAVGPAQSYFMAGPAVGAPMAVLTLEKLIALGARQIIVFGWCGALSESLHLNDLFLPTWALSEEGTSGHYPVKARPESSQELIKVLLSRLVAREAKLLEGAIWTTDAPYRETRAKVRSYGKQAILAVDMEFSALCTVAAFRKVRMAAVLIVSDELWRPSWRPGYRNREFKKKSAEIFGVLTDCCRFFPAAATDRGEKSVRRRMNEVVGAK